MLLLASSVCGLFSWRVDETYIRVKGKWVYLYRAVDSTGATIDFLLSAKRDAAAAERFLAKALGGENHPAPRVINTDKHAAYPPAIAELKADGVLDENSKHRPVQYLNNILEQDHRAIKRRVRASQHFRSFWGAWRTIAGYEAIHMIRKGQACVQCRSTAPLHSRSVRGDELKCRSSTPTFGSTTKLQHIRSESPMFLTTLHPEYRIFSRCSRLPYFVISRASLPLALRAVIIGCSFRVVQKSAWILCHTTTENINEKGNILRPGRPGRGQRLSTRPD